MVSVPVVSLMVYFNRLDRFPNLSARSQRRRAYGCSLSPLGNWSDTWEGSSKMYSSVDSPRFPLATLTTSYSWKSTAGGETAGSEDGGQLCSRAWQCVCRDPAASMKPSKSSKIHLSQREVWKTPWDLAQIANDLTIRHLLFLSLSLSR
jgi:hypothetical protein